MKVPDVVTIDFETEGIAKRPNYPPVPVGVSIKQPGDKRSWYLAWGHPTENNSTKEEAGRILKSIWKDKYPVLCHNAKFDTDVAETYFGLSRLPWERAQDTLYLLFLQDPHASSLSLKPSAARLLGMPPEERDVVKDWVLAHVPEAKRRPSEWGAYICRAPGKLVGTYANGDVTRTEKLFQKLYPEIVERGMLKAYERERKLMPILLDTERVGIRADWERMEYDYVAYLLARDAADAWLRKQLDSPNLNLDADKDVADALDRAGVVTEWTYTAPTKTHPSGVRSVSKKNMTLERFRNKQVASVYGYRVRLSTCLSMFFRPWLEMARESGGIIYTTWQQVRQSHGNDSFVGARTGRLSSSPNFQNIPTDFEDKGDGYIHPAFLHTLPLPLMRRYLLPDSDNHLWGHRDINQQELRFAAHFEDGVMCEHYNREPRFDIHTTMRQYIRDTIGVSLTRSATKILNFADLYGRGLGELAKGLGVDVETAKHIRAAKNDLMPGIDALNKLIKACAKRNEPIVTWGGRQYFCEKPMFIEKFNRKITFEYKLLNYLIQGSSADFTKEAVIAYDAHPKRRARFLLTVHDEINISSPKLIIDKEMEILREALESVPGVDVPMCTDGKVGRNWGELVYRDGDPTKEPHPIPSASSSHRNTIKNIDPRKYNN